MLQALNLKLKLAILTGSFALALVANIITGSIGIHAGANGVEEIGHKRLPSILALQKLQGYQTALRSSTYEAALWENDPEAQEMFQGIAADKQRVWGLAETTIKEYQALPKTAEEEQRWKAFVSEWEKWKTFDQDIIKLILTLAQNKDFARQKALFQDYFILGGKQRPAYQSAEKLLNEVLQTNAANVQKVTEEAVTTTLTASRAMNLVAVLAVLASAALGVFISISILRQIGGEPSEVAEITNRIAHGDLSQTITPPKCAKNCLMSSIINMQNHLRGLIGQVQSSSVELTRRAQALSRDMGHVEQNGVEEANAARHTAEQVSHISGRINHIGNAADQASSLSVQAGTLSHEGQEVMGGLVKEMEFVSNSVHQSATLVQQLGNYSNQITSIVSVIKEIADQTNLLALNAAIEAARAGEQGRGFAVVADEVRKLAERTAGSTEEISQVIHTIQRSVEDAVKGMEAVNIQVAAGVGEVRNASNGMARINTGALDASKAVNGIHSAISESLSSLSQIEASMGNIVGLVERNGNAVGAMSNASRRVEELAGELSSAIARFRL
jgi:methyl-accepting chemotaxis protein